MHNGDRGRIYKWRYKENPSHGLRPEGFVAKSKDPTGEPQKEGKNTLPFMKPTKVAGVSGAELVRYRLPDSTTGGNLINQFWQNLIKKKEMKKCL